MHLGEEEGYGSSEERVVQMILTSAVANRPIQCEGAALLPRQLILHEFEFDFLQIRGTGIGIVRDGGGGNCDRAGWVGNDAERERETRNLPIGYGQLDL